MMIKCFIVYIISHKCNCVTSIKLKDSMNYLLVLKITIFQIRFIDLGVNMVRKEVLQNEIHAEGKLSM